MTAASLTRRVWQSPSQTVAGVAPGRCVQAVRNEGVFQGKDGVSGAIEARPLGPSPAHIPQSLI